MARVGVRLAHFGVSQHVLAVDRRLGLDIVLADELGRIVAFLVDSGDVVEVLQVVHEVDWLFDVLG